MFTIDKGSFPEREEKVLKLWKEKSTFKKSLEKRSDAPVFSTYDGPPFATGLPHYGHLLAGTIKDVVPRYKTMKGFCVPRRFGWDTHGLPVENEIEKAKALAGGPEIEAFGIANFNEECRSIVLRYVEEWKETVERMGRWVDFDQTYKTMDKTYMESVWWVFGELWKQGLVYQGFKVMPFSAKLGTPLSNFEANLNYKDVDDPSLTVRFKLKDKKNRSLLAWTTTPWTLVSNLATIVNPKMTYVTVVHEGEELVLAKSRVKSYFGDDVEVLEEFSGEELVGERYEPLFSYFSDTENAFQVLGDDFVGEEDGTGIVHAAPAFGEMDFFVCTREKIEAVCPVDHNGKFTSEVPEYEGTFIKDADKEIIRHLKGKDSVFKHSRIRHRYPFCWRSDTPLIYKAVDTWFIAVEKIKDKIVSANKQIHWVPGHLKEGRFGKWLDNARDWAVSRNRYWGTPMPIWQSSCGDCIAISSVAELEELSGEKIDDLHRHFVDEITFEKNGKTYKRVSEVFDCWFESGSMPYAQNHYPFENKELVENTFPADFIAEGLDQTRGWFYTLTVLGAALFDKPAFKNVIVNGILLAEDGNKMSKRLKNYPDPREVINEFGADAVRLYMLHSPAVQGDDLRFAKRGVELVVRQVLIPMWNSFVFLSTYANIYKWEPESEKVAPVADIDRWILSRLQKLILSVETGMDKYELSAAVHPFTAFVDELTNWYIRRCRPRFWADEDSQDRREAFSTLYRVIKGLVKVAAPFVPFIADTIYQELRKDSEPESVHLCDFPTSEKQWIDDTLELEMASVRSAVSMGHALRKEHSLKVRQPLASAHLVSSDAEVLAALKRQENLIKDELNVKTIEFHTDESAFVQVSAKPNYPVMGRKVGKLMKAIKAPIENLSLEEIDTLASGGSITLDLGTDQVAITSEDVEIVRNVKEGVVAASEGAITITLDRELTEELLVEGLARELVNKLNTMRREGGFEVQDRIKVTIDTTERMKSAFETHHDYVCHEVLATDVTFHKNFGTEWDLNGETATISIQKA
jgi:isoleucyl-tRNA synthetase